MSLRNYLTPGWSPHTTQAPSACGADYTFKATIHFFGEHL